MDIRDALREKGWTQADLAREVGRDQGTVSRVIKGKAAASLALALAIEKALGGLVRAEDLPLSETSRADLERHRSAA